MSNITSQEFGSDIESKAEAELSLKMGQASQIAELAYMIAREQKENVGNEDYSQGRKDGLVDGFKETCRALGFIVGGEDGKAQSGTEVEYDPAVYDIDETTSYLGVDHAQYKDQVGIVGSKLDITHPEVGTKDSSGKYIRLARARVQMPYTTQQKPALKRAA